jgi:hypothetical protein
MAVFGSPLAATPALAQGLDLAGAAADDPLVQDAEAYAAVYEVDLEEALLRLRLQPVIGKLQAELAASEPATFAGLWIQNEPSYLIVARFTEGGGGSLQALLQRDEYLALYPYVDVRPAALSLPALSAVQAAAHEATRAYAPVVQSMINVPENRVDLQTTEVDLVAHALQAADDARRPGAAPLLPHVAVVEVEALIAPQRYIHAGRAINLCTSAFAVQNAGGTRGVLTAGHCPDAQSFNLRNLPFQAGQFSGSVDAQWHTVGELHAVNRIWDGVFDTTTPFYRFVTATRPRAQQVVGEVVCKFGIATNQTCGTISNTSFLPPSGPGQWVNPTATFIYVTGGAVNLSEGGDSGGPWYSNTTAYGIHSGGGVGAGPPGDPRNDAIYMAIDFISALGVTVLTTTPTLNVGRFTYRAMGDNINAYTEVNANDYECGLAGSAALDGDIQEHNAGDIVQNFLSTANSHFNFRADFRTHNNQESWDFDLLCLRRNVYSVGRFVFNSLGDNITFNTGLSTTTWECGIGGLAALDGDIQEHDSGDIIQAYMFRSGPSWWVRADFRTHNNQESWNIHALCVNRAHPVTRFEFKNLGDNVNGFNTGVSTATHECGVAGYAARDGDIQEHDSGNPIQTFLFASGGTWRIRADFRTHNNSESWDIDVLCVQR